jgi:hypothetical protein
MHISGNISIIRTLSTIFLCSSGPCLSSIAYLFRPWQYCAMTSPTRERHVFDKTKEEEYRPDPYCLVSDSLEGCAIHDHYGGSE